MVSAYKLLARCCWPMPNSDWFKAVGPEEPRVLNNGPGTVGGTE